MTDEQLLEKILEEKREELRPVFLAIVKAFFLGAQQAREDAKEKARPDLDALLEDYEVFQIDYEGLTKAQHIKIPEDWYSVSTGDEGDVAYFKHERDACAFRLLRINDEMNHRPRS